jgi:NAD dependent epimerase/dehydratase
MPATSSQSAPGLGRVLVTGAAGFIGSHLVEAVLPRASHVRALVRYNSRNDAGWLESSPCRSEIEIALGDVRDFDGVSQAVKGCDTVFHLAALIGIPYSYVNPVGYVRTNVEGTANLLQAAREHQVSNVIVTSTSETYGTAQSESIDEDHPLVAQSPYAASKIGADQLALSYHKSFGLPVKVVRPFNTYGPRQSERAIIPVLIGQIAEGTRKVRVGNVTPVRDFTFVGDTADGFVAIAETAECMGSVTNLGTNSSVSVGQLIERIAELMGEKVEVETDASRVRPDNSEVMRLQCNNARVLSLTPWRPKHDLTSGLGKTIEWFRAQARSERAMTYVI